MHTNVFDLLLISCILHCLETIHDGIAIHLYRVTFGFEVTSNIFTANNQHSCPVK